MADYKSAHLAWIYSTKSFTPKYAHDYRADISYYEIMKQTYNNPSCTQDMAKSFFVADKLWHKQTFCLSKEIDKEIEKSLPSPSEKWFMTIGFNHDTWTVKDCDKCITKILGMEWIKSGKANFELHREGGVHPHVHFIIETKEPQSRIVDKVYRPLYVKKLVSKRNFVEVTPMMEYHLKYINLDKKEDKMQYVKKDIEWRKKNNIPDYEKNWEAD
uniref:hypothetical protein n=1 Tax=Mariniflexile sp. TaxID=1979402 RepID=UPI004047A95A